MRNTALPALRFLACGSFQQVVGYILGIDKSTVSRVIFSFLQSIKRRKDFVKIPFADEEKDMTKQGCFKLVDPQVLLDTSIAVT